MRLHRRIERVRRWLAACDYPALGAQVAISLLILLLVALASDDGAVREAKPLPGEQALQVVVAQSGRHKEQTPIGAQAAARDEGPATTLAPSNADDFSAAPVFEMTGPFLSADGISLRRGDGIVRLGRIEAPRADDVCEDGGGSLWACGLHARAALHNLLAGRDLVCRPTGKPDPATTVADCRFKAGGGAASDDLAARLVRLGWARPIAGAEGEFAEQEAAARKEVAGLWRGGWTIKAR